MSPIRARSVVCLSLFVWLLGCSQAGHSEPRQVTTSASGEVMAVPDMAVVSGSVEVEADTAREATQLAQKRLEQVIQFVRKQGVDNKDLNAATVQVHPRWHYPRNRQPEVVGYQARAGFNIKLRDLSGLGELYAGLPEAGATRLDDTDFDFSQREALELEAIAKAVRNAQARARAAVEALGGRLGQAVNVQVNTQWQQPPMQRTYMMAAKMESDAAGAPELNPGDHTLSATATVSFAID